jgi:predicted MFS family arabinose efflux permease
LIYWRTAFYVFGALGVVWCVLFAMRFHNRPREDASVNAAERQLIEAGTSESHESHAGVPWRKLLGSANLWVLCLMYFCAAYGWYFNITYLPRFLEEQHHVPATDVWGALYKGGPLWVGAAGCLIGGMLTDWFIRRTGNRRLGRRLFGIVGHAMCAGCYLLCPLTETPFTFFLAISAAAFANDLTMGSAWSTCQDIGKRYAAIVAGCMNTIGNLGGAVAGYATGFILQQSLNRHADTLNVPVEQLTAAQKSAGLLDGYHLNFYSFAGVYMVAVVCWFVIDSTKPVAEEAA